MGDNSETKSISARKSLFKSPILQKSGALSDGNNPDYILLEWIQRQSIYIKALEKELTHFRVIWKTADIISVSANYIFSL